jgi:hypothetical protein
LSDFAPALAELEERCTDQWIESRARTACGIRRLRHTGAFVGFSLDFGWTWQQTSATWHLKLQGNSCDKQDNLPQWVKHCEKRNGWRFGSWIWSLLFSTFEQFSTPLQKGTTMMTMMADDTFDALQSAEEKAMCACNSKDNLDRVWSFMPSLSCLNSRHSKTAVGETVFWICWWMLDAQSVCLGGFQLLHSVREVFSLIKFDAASRQLQLKARPVPGMCSWMDWWIDGVDSLMAWWLCGFPALWLHGWMDRQIDGSSDWWIDGLMDWWIDGLMN